MIASVYWGTEPPGLEENPNRRQWHLTVTSGEGSGAISKWQYQQKKETDNNFGSWQDLSIGDAIVELSTAGYGNIAVAPTRLVFTPSNCDAPQTVTVTAAVDDDLLDDTATVTHTASGLNSGYAGITAILTAMEDDTAVLATATPTPTPTPMPTPTPARATPVAPEQPADGGLPALL